MEFKNFSIMLAISTKLDHTAILAKICQEIYFIHK